MMLNIIIPAFVVCCLLFPSLSFPVNDEEEAALYLQKFGYLEDSTGYRVGAILGPDAISNAIKDFQRFAGLNQTGELDNDTITMMNTPRCGVKDKIGHSDAARKKRYALQGSKWRVTHLTYRITKYPTRLKDRTKVDKEVARAFKIWSDVTTLSFEERKRGRVNIDIRFERGEHGDGDAFDGPGKTLAHAFFPQFGGDAHFDDEEKWTIDERSGTNMFQVAAHEFGHSLGLSHSDEKRALMAPYYRGYQPSFKLDVDDVKAIQALYGSRDQPSPPEDDEPSGPPPDTSDAPDLCQDASIDTVTRTQNGSSYVFKGEFYWKILKDGIADGYPRKISEDWDGLEGNLDASFTWSNGKTYFFKGGRYWRFTNKDMDSGYPKLLRNGFDGIPDMLDAAFVWSGNGKTYFFKGDEYWRYDSNNDPPVSERYPKPISNWRGLPNNLDAAFQWENSRTYFFKGDKYYRFNDISFEVDSGDPPYPRSTSVWWFDCQSISHRTNATQSTTTDEELEIRGTNMVQDAPHETSHSLGLSHVVEKRALMTTYNDYLLDLYDLKSFQPHYGFRNQQSAPEDDEPSDPPPDTSDAPDLCQDASIDAVTRTQDGSSYVFKGEFYWKILDNAIDDGYPRKISEDWDGLEGDLDAAFTWSNGKTYFSKGERFWRFTNKDMDSGYPKLLGDGFEDIPDMLDAAFVWSGNGKTYFFKGDQYWRYDSNDDPPVSDIFPQPISNWRGLPNNLDAAFQWENNVTYFFKEDKYYKFNDITSEVDDLDPPYPRPTSTWWFGCQSPSQSTNAAQATTTVQEFEIIGSSGQPSPPKADESSSPQPDTSAAPNLCQDASIDTVTRTQDGSSYVFKGEFYWKIFDNAIADGYPRKISEDWNGLEGNLDASFTGSDGKTNFFKGGRYWRFTNKDMDNGYPKQLKDGFNGIPDKLDAAVLWSGNGKPYFFKGDQYWRYDINDDPPVSNIFPQPISNWWRGLPNNLDAAFRWENNVTYFFKEDKYYKFNDITSEVDDLDPPYPRPTSTWWFGCQSPSQSTNAAQATTTVQEFEIIGSSGQPSPPKADESSSPQPDTSAAPNLCQDASIDTVTRTQDGSSYVFKGEFYWKIFDNAIADGYPRKISEDWNGLEGNLDASFTGSDGKTNFFKGGRYWRFTNKDMDNGYPKQLKDGFNGIPDKLDAAVLWSGNGKPYFFKGDQYWRYDINDDPPVSNIFPQPISNWWRGLPNNLDAAFRWENNVTYFFKEDKYYKFNDITSEVDFGDPPYPRSTSVWWFGC